MARYTTTESITFGTNRDSRAIIVAGTLTVEAFDGVAYVDTDVLTTGSYEYFTKGLRLRFTPGAGDNYSIEEGEQQ